MHLTMLIAHPYPLQIVGNDILKSCNFYDGNGMNNNGDAFEWMMEE